jgi:hypothetical protein
MYRNLYYIIAVLLLRQAAGIRIPRISLSQSPVTIRPGPVYTTVYTPTTSTDSFTMMSLAVSTHFFSRFSFIRHMYELNLLKKR